MKTIGIIGGMCWESTIIYYQEINQILKKELKGNTSAKCVIYSVDFSEIENAMEENNWDLIFEILKNGIRTLEYSKVDFIIIASNTAHKIYDELQDITSIPIIHITDSLANEIRKYNLNCMLLLGTKLTMKENFIRDKLEKNNIDIIIPNDEDIRIIDETIKKIDINKTNSELKKNLITIIEKYDKIDGVILGCTELGIILKEKDLLIPILDTTIIHARDGAFRAIK